MKYVGYVVTFIFVAAIGSVVSGYTFSVLWGWFIVSTFGLPELSIPAAIGLALNVSFLNPSTADSVKGQDFSDLMIDSFSKVVGKCLSAIGIGWVVLQFI